MPFSTVPPPFGLGHPLYLIDLNGSDAPLLHIADFMLSHKLSGAAYQDQLKLLDKLGLNVELPTNFATLREKVQALVFNALVDVRQLPQFFHYQRHGSTTRLHFPFTSRSARRKPLTTTSCRSHCFSRWSSSG
jgi:hypothetical protein